MVFALSFVLLSSLNNPALADDYIKLFGSLEFRGNLNGVPAWLEVLEKNKNNPILIPGSRLNSSTNWDQLQSILEGQSPMEQLRSVNSFWNQWPYRTDREVWGKDDYWASPAEFRDKSGDCEDYSIAKYFTLRAVGWEADSLRIVVVTETVTGMGHAVLVAYLDGDAWVLDNLNASVLSHTRLPNYVPSFSVNEDKRWAHIVP